MTSNPSPPQQRSLFGRLGSSSGVTPLPFRHLAERKLTVVSSNRFFSHSFENGLTLVAESMPWLESAAFSLMTPAGIVTESPERLGLANLVTEMSQRGCGKRDSRAFVEDLENLGADTACSTGITHVHYGGASPHGALFETLSIYADVVQRPMLPEEQLEDARQLCLQEIRAVEDEAAQLAMQELRLRHYGTPWGNPTHGTMESVSSIAMDDVREHWSKNFGPDGAILAVAGKIDWPSLRKHVEIAFGNWKKQKSAPTQGQAPARGCKHIHKSSSQTQISVGYESIPFRHDDFYKARAAVGVLSDGMSSRLFTEVREVRGLCYSVHASCQSLRDRGAVFSYAGTTTERAQETLDVLCFELLKLTKGVTSAELNRLKVKIKSNLIMQQESSRSRASSIAGDWYHLGRIRPIEEIRRKIDELTDELVNEYLAANPPKGFSIVTLGENPLETPHGIS